VYIIFQKKLGGVSLYGIAIIHKNGIFRTQLLYQCAYLGKTAFAVFLIKNIIIRQHFAVYIAGSQYLYPDDIPFAAADIGRSLGAGGQQGRCEKRQKKNFKIFFIFAPFRRPCLSHNTNIFN